MLIMIAAMSRGRVIANDNGIPWAGMLPRDVAHFRNTTEGHTVVMGGAVYRELDEALPHRKNLVITHQKPPLRTGFQAVADLKAVCALALKEDVYIIGGAQIYKIFMPFADRLVLTKIEATFEGAVTFPPLSDQWKFVHEATYQQDKENKFDFAIRTYERQ